MGNTPTRSTSAPAEVSPAHDNRTMVENALRGEEETIARYTRRAQQAEGAGEILGLLEAATMLVTGRGAVAGAVERVLLCVVVAWLSGLAWLRFRADDDEST